MAFELFSKDLDTIELKFIGLFFVIMLGVISLIIKVDLITGFLGGVVAMMVRDLYRQETNKKPKEG